MKILLAALTGGLAMFAWGCVTHALPPLAHSGMTFTAPDSPAVEALRTGFPQDGMYVFPGPRGDFGDKAVMNRMTEDTRKGPAGLLFIRPHGDEPMMTRQLVIEFVSDVLAALIAALLLACTTLRSYGARVLFVTEIGLAAWLTLQVSYWNWYHFPTAQTGAELVDLVGGFLVAGLAIAAFVKPVPRS